MGWRGRVAATAAGAFITLAAVVLALVYGAEAGYRAFLAWFGHAAWASAATAGALLLFIALLWGVLALAMHRKPEPKRPPSLADDAMDFVRRNPKVLVGAALLAGLVVGRKGRMGALASAAMMGFLRSGGKLPF